MAQMHPEELPVKIVQNKMFRGEAMTFAALSRLPNDYVVFYNRCASRGFSAKAYDRPIDFLIMHEQYGLLAMEVKGGQIRIGDSGEFEQYLSKSRFWKKTDPFAQVKIALRDMIMTCKTDGADYWIPDDCCVIFPETKRTELTNIPQNLPAGTLCAEDLALIPQLLPKLFTKSKGGAWKRSDFIDMRRRLQNMPIARKKTDSNQKEFKVTENLHLRKKVSPAHKSFSVHSTEENKKIELKQTESQDLIYAQIHSRSKKRLAVSEAPNELKVHHYLLGVILFFIIVFCISWLFPNSVIHNLILTVIASISL